MSEDSTRVIILFPALPYSFISWILMACIFIPRRRSAADGLTAHALTATHSRSNTTAADSKLQFEPFVQLRGRGVHTLPYIRIR